jgi:hypothetical protein
VEEKQAVLMESGGLFEVQHATVESWWQRKLKQRRRRKSRVIPSKKMIDNKIKRKAFEVKGSARMQTKQVM